jgi:DNA-binding MarR family transcriptional regulator
MKENSFVSSYLLYLLAAVSHRVSAQFHDHARAQGLRVPEWRVLACLADGDGAMITELARLALMEQSRMTRIVDQMQRRGLVARAADPADGRRVRVHLTPQGRALADSLVADARTHEAQVLAGLDPADAARIRPMLAAMLDRLDTPRDPAPPDPAP